MQQCKRKATESETDDDAAAKISRPKRQKYAPDLRTLEQRKQDNIVSQSTVDDAIIAYIVSEYRLLSTVEKDFSCTHLYAVPNCNGNVCGMFVFTAQ